MWASSPTRDEGAARLGSRALRRTEGTAARLGSRALQSARRRTREQRRRRRETLWRVVIVGLGLTILLAVLRLDDAPTAGAGVAEGAATVAAGQEYDRVVELYGDRTAAELCAQRVYGEVLDAWSQGR